MNTFPVNRRIELLSETEARQISQIGEDCRLARWSQTDYQNEPNRRDSIFLVAETANGCVGFLVARITGSIVVEADLLNMGVLNDYRKHGIGRELFEQFVNELSKAGGRAVWLEVRRSNDDAIRFYREKKFQIIQARKNFYSNPTEDALVMKLEIGKTTLKRM